MCKLCAGGGGVPPLSDVPIDGMLITYEWPDQINLNSSDIIRMKITTNACKSRLSSRHDSGVKYGIEHRSTPSPETKVPQTWSSSR